MIIEYHRPQTLESALQLLGRDEPLTLPMGGGTVLSRPGRERYAVVDLQALGLNEIVSEGNLLRIGALSALQQLFESDALQPALRAAAHRETSLNLRQVSTVAGTLVVSDGRSIFATALLALDARLIWQPQDREIGLGEYLPLRENFRGGRLISEVRVPSNPRIEIETVARSPEDRPIVIVAAAKWPSGRTRVAVGGFGAAPMLAMDGTEPAGAVQAVRQAFSSSSDQWATAEYRVEAAGILTGRCLEQVGV